MKFLSGLISNIAQITLIVILFPLIAWMFDFSNLLTFLGSIPIFDTWIDVLYRANNLDLDNLAYVYLSSVFETLVVGICTHVFIKIHKILGAYGLPIFATFLGVTLACVLFRALSFAGAFELVLYIVILAVGIFLMIKGVFRSVKLFSLKDFFELIVECVFSVMICGYITALSLFSTGLIGVSVLMLITLLTIVMAIVTWLVTKNDSKKT
ncbi:MAG: hypothetical protein IJ275_06295 [Ruminococcus sp.]|nr:hypothetical protein [Ruminococcus sp.]